MPAATHDVALLPFLEEVEISLRVDRFAILVGPPGSGKTTCAKHLARQATGQEPVVLQASKDVNTHEIWGRDRIVDGDSAYAPGKLLRALQQNRWLLVEEGFLLPNPVWACFMELRGAEHVEHPISGVRIEIPDTWRMIVTSNPLGRSCRAAREILEAFLDATHVTDIEPMRPEQIEEILRLHVPTASDEHVRFVIATWTDFRDRSANPRKGKHLKQPSVRNALALLRRLEAGDTPHRAVRVALVNQLITDPEAHEAAKLRHAVSY